MSGDIDAAKVAQLDSVDNIKDLIRVGNCLADEVQLEYLRLERFGQLAE